MKTTRLLALAVLLVAAASFTPGLAQEHPATTEHPADAEHPTKAVQPADAGDIVGIAAAAGNFKTLSAAIEAAGLTETLRGKGPFTVFAPTDAAFAKLPKEMLDDLMKPANKAQLAGLLACHVVPGRIAAADIKTMKATAVSGQDLDIVVTKGTVTVDGAKVTKTDITATNGVIHAIDTVIIPTAAAPAPATDAPKDHPAH